MQQVLIHNLTHPAPSPIQARLCKSFFCRLRGLMFFPSIGPDEGLLMMQPRSDRMDAAIHMLFMNFDITTVWLDDNLSVVDTRLCHRWHPAYVPSTAARYVLEAHAIRKDDFLKGDQLFFEPC